MDNSHLQDGLLAALPSAHEKPIAAAEILGVDSPSSVSQRASLSRSLARLADRGLVNRYHPEIYLHGRGYLWAKA
jgi:hypothetical protein